MKVNEAAKRAGVSVRTLHYYEELGLIFPARNDENGYRCYDEATVARARLAHSYRELQIPLKQVRLLLDAAPEERDELLEEQVQTLERRREQIDNRIAMLQMLRLIGTERIAEVDMNTLDEQMARVKQMMSESNPIQAMNQRMGLMTQEDCLRLDEEKKRIFVEIGRNPEDETAIFRLKSFFDENFFPCTDGQLLTYAKFHGGDGQLAREIDALGGEGCASRALAAVKRWTEGRK